MRRIALVALLVLAAVAWAVVSHAQVLAELQLEQDEHE